MTSHRSIYFLRSAIRPGSDRSVSQQVPCDPVGQRDRDTDRAERERSSRREVRDDTLGLLLASFANILAGFDQVHPVCHCLNVLAHPSMIDCRFRAHLVEPRAEISEPLIELRYQRHHRRVRDSHYDHHLPTHNEHDQRDDDKYQRNVVQVNHFGFHPLPM